LDWDVLVNEKDKTRLPWLTRFLRLRIILGMVLGVALGFFVPQVLLVIGPLSIGTTCIVTAIGPIWMIFPPLTKVRYEDL